MTLDIESIDLREVTSALRARLGSAVEGAVVGKTRLRDEAAVYLGWSQLHAENLVDTLAMRGFIVLVEERDGRVVWRVNPHD